MDKETIIIYFIFIVIFCALLFGPTHYYIKDDTNSIIINNREG
jgi:hypothetical protein